jgi:hypothetical protein
MSGIDPSARPRLFALCRDNYHQNAYGEQEVMAWGLEFRTGGAYVIWPGRCVAYNSAVDAEDMLFGRDGETYLVWVQR